MSERLHIVLSAEEKERYRAIAEREGTTLSEWIRESVRERAERYSAEHLLRTPEDVDRYFATLDEDAGPGCDPEPDWTEYERLIEDGRREGLSG